MRLDCIDFLITKILSGNAPFQNFSREKRAGWIEKNLDKTPVDSDVNDVVFESAHLDLMKWCFNFHASKRPTMKEVVDIMATIY